METLQGKGLSTQKSSWAEETSLDETLLPGWPIPLCQQGCHFATVIRMRKFSDSPQIGSPRFIRVETRTVGVLISENCQPYGPHRGVSYMRFYFLLCVPFDGFGINGGGRK